MSAYILIAWAIEFLKASNQYLTISTPKGLMQCDPALDDQQVKIVQRLGLRRSSSGAGFSGRCGDRWRDCSGVAGSLRRASGEGRCSQTHPTPRVINQQSGMFALDPSETQWPGCPLVEKQWNPTVFSGRRHDEAADRAPQEPGDRVFFGLLVGLGLPGQVRVQEQHSGLQQPGPHRLPHRGAQGHRQAVSRHQAHPRGSSSVSHS